MRGRTNLALGGGGRAGADLARRPANPLELLRQGRVEEGWGWEEEEDWGSDRGHLLGLPPPHARGSGGGRRRAGRGWGAGAAAPDRLSCPAGALGAERLVHFAMTCAVHGSKFSAKFQ